MNAAVFLGNAQKVKQYLLFSQKNKEKKDMLEEYLSSRIRDSDSYVGSNFEKVKEFVRNPGEILSYLKSIKLEKQK